MFNVKCDFILFYFYCDIYLCISIFARSIQAEPISLPGLNKVVLFLHQREEDKLRPEILTQ